jgi:thiamine-phosphate pyrophosphorylase
VAPQLPPPLTRAARLALLRGPYVIVNDGRGSPDPVDIARACIEAGVYVVQYRAKCGIDTARLRSLREMTAQSGALLVVNDDIEAALAFECDGVHLGPDDGAFAGLDPVRARFNDRLIGVSAGTPDEARAAQAAGADYIGIGAVFATASKDDAGAPIGLHGLRAVAAACALPAAAIGGIDRENIAAVARTGVAMAAVISAVAGARDPVAAARELVHIWNRERPE